MTTLRNKLDVERERRNDLEQYGRRENLRFVKLGPDSSSETTTQCEDKVLAIINEKLKLGHITKQHISVAHRVGQFSKGYQRQVIVRFVSRRHRMEVIQARRNLKGSGIAIVEDLTPLNKERLDRVSKHKAVKSIWTKDGRIFALLADKRVVKIEKGDLSKLPRKLSEPPPRDSQAGSNHSDQHRPAYDVQYVSSWPTPSTPTACPTVSVGIETTPL